MSSRNFDQRHGAQLRFKHSLREPGEPVGNLRIRVVALQGVIIALALDKYRRREGGQRRLSAAISSV